MAPNDLAESIVALGKAAEQRRQARRTLIEATGTVAASLTKHLRRGDEVNVPSATEQHTTVTYRVVRVRKPGVTFATQYINVLARSDAILSEIDLEDDFDGPLTSPEYAWDFTMASDAQRLAFAREAPAVVDTFRELLALQAAADDAAAQAITKLRVR